MLPIRADGDCLFHLAHTIEMLLFDPSYLCNGVAPCFISLVGGVKNIMRDRFRVWQAAQKNNCACMEKFGMEPEEVLAELSNPHLKGDQMLLALFLSAYNISLVVVTSSKITPNSNAEDSDVFQQFSHFVETPTHVVCAVLVGDSSDHWDLAVVSCPTNNYRAVFSVHEWPSCRAHILTYLKQGPVQTSRWQTPPNAGGR